MAMYDLADTDMVATRATHSKRDHVMRILTASGAQFLIQTDSEATLARFIATANTPPQE